MEKHLAAAGIANASSGVYVSVAAIEAHIMTAVNNNIFN